MDFGRFQVIQNQLVKTMLVVGLALAAGVPAHAQSLEGLKQARAVRASVWQDAALVNLQVNGQNMTLFQGALQMIQAFEQAPVLSQERQTQNVSAREILANPFLLYRNLEDLDLSRVDMSDVDAMMTAVFRVLAKADLPAGFLNSPLKIRVDNAIRKMNLAVFTKLAENVSEKRETRELLAELQRDAEASSALNRGLVHPELNASDRQALSAFLGGFLWRFRGAGGYDGLGTNARRDLFVQKGFAAIARLNGAGSSASAIAMAIRAGVQNTSWGQYHDMGRLPGADRFADFVQMEKLGRDMMGWAKQTLKLSGYGDKAVYATMAGATMASCYAYAWEKIPVTYQVGTNLGAPYLFIFGAPTNFGELCTGASIGLALHEIIAVK